MDQERKAEWRNRVVAALEGATDWYDVERDLQKTVTDEEIEEARPLVYAFGYMLLESRHEDSRERHNVAFAPRIEWPNGAAFPEPLEEVGESIISSWANWADEIDDPVALSRFHDLLWERRHGDRPDNHARKAARAYLDLAVSEWDPLERAFCAVRALELARAVNDEELVQGAISACIEIADVELGVEEWRPGITLRAIESLVDLPAPVRPAAVAELLGRARDRYSADPWIDQSITDLEATLAASAEKPALYETQVQRWRDEAAKATGILKYAHLQHALELARTHGFREQADEILAELQSLTVEDLDLKPITAEVAIPPEATDRFIDGLARLGSWQDAMTVIGVQEPPITTHELDSGRKDEPPPPASLLDPSSLSR